MVVSPPASGGTAEPQVRRPSATAKSVGAAAPDDESSVGGDRKDSEQVRSNVTGDGNATGASADLEQSVGATGAGLDLPAPPPGHSWLLCWVKAHPGCTMHELVQAVDHHYSRDSTAKSSLYKWIHAGLIGVELRDGALYPATPEEATA